MRARNLKPFFFKDSKILRCEAYARLLFEGLWCYADCKGRFVWDIIEIKNEILPFDNVDIEDLLFQLLQVECIQQYEVDNKLYGYIPNFKKHQNPHPNEKVADVPEPTEENIKKINDIARSVSVSCKTVSDRASSLYNVIMKDDIRKDEVLDKSKTPPNGGIAQGSFLDPGAATQQEQELLNYWNATFAGVKGISRSRDLAVKDINGVPLLTHITSAMAKYTLDQLKQAVTNFKEVLTSPDYWYKLNRKYNLAQFLSSGIKEGKGFVTFLDENQPLLRFRTGTRNSDKPLDAVEVYRQAFSPITIRYSAIFDKTTGSYYGFNANTMLTIQGIRSRLQDLKDHGFKELEQGNISYYRELEKVIAGLLWNRKQLAVEGKEEFFRTNFLECMSIWNQNKDKFKEAAERMKNNS